MSADFLNQDTVNEWIKRELFQPKKSIYPKGEVGKIGIELEAFPYTFSNENKPIPVPLNDQNFPLMDRLASLSQEKSAEFIYGGAQLDKILYPNGTSIQFEPGGQVEIATAPHPSFSDLEVDLESKQQIFDQLTAENQIHFGQYGTNPWFQNSEIGLQLQKPRYQALEAYLDKISPFGRQMMRQTCSLHVNLDLGDDKEIQVKRILISNLLVPFIAAIFANSAHLGGKATGKLSYRRMLWQQLDPLRTGLFPKLENVKSIHKEDLVQAYEKLIWNAPLVFVPDFGSQEFSYPFTFQNWVKNPIQSTSPNLNHLKNHISLLFPEVRMKGFLEIRTADSLPRKWQLTPAYFLAGILYSNSHLDQAFELLASLSPKIQQQLEMCTDGLKSELLFQPAKELMEIAIHGLKELPETFVGKNSIPVLTEFSERFTQKRLTVAEEMIYDFFNGKT